MKLFSLAVAALTFVSAGFEASSETVSRKSNFSFINGVKAGSHFVVNLVDGKDFSVELVLEAEIADCVSLNLVEGILEVNYDESNMPKEVKAALRKKDPRLVVMNVNVSIPSGSNFNKINLLDNATLSSSSSITGKDFFSIEMDGMSSIKSLTVNAKEIVLTTHKRSNGKLSLTSGKTTVNSDGNSVLGLNVGGSNANVAASGASQINMDSSVEQLNVNASSSSKITLAGTCAELSVMSKGSAYVDSFKLTAKNARMDMQGGYCDVNALEKLSLKLSSGAKLCFDGDPKIEIVKIERANVSRKSEQQESGKASRK